jgi:hypothetical protein
LSERFSAAAILTDDLPAARISFSARSSFSLHLLLLRSAMAGRMVAAVKQRLERGRAYRAFTAKQGTAYFNALGDLI